jgi:hypothetical protein
MTNDSPIQLPEDLQDEVRKIGGLIEEMQTGSKDASARITALMTAATERYKDLLATTEEQAARSAVDHELHELLRQGGSYGAEKIRKDKNLDERRKRGKHTN